MTKKILLTLALLLVATAAEAVTYTPNYNLSQPEDNYTETSPSWGSLYRSNMSAIDTAIYNAVQAAGSKLPLAGGTLTGPLVMAADIQASGSRSVGAPGAPFAAGYFTSVYAKGMTIAGIVRNGADGLLSGGSSIDVSADTNLSAASPITLTGDQVGWNGTTANVPENPANLYYTQARVDARAAALIQDSPQLDWVYVAGTSLKASLIYSAVDHNQLLNAGGNQHIDWTNASSNFYTTGTLRGSGATLAGMTVAGFVKNSAGGVLTGGAAVDISSDTNLGVASPITLTGDQIGWNGTTSNVPEGSNLYYTQARFDARAAALIQNSPQVTWTYVAGTSLKAALVEGQINHNALLNYVANQHIDWTISATALSVSGGFSGGNAVYGSNSNTTSYSTGVRGIASGSGTFPTYGVYGETFSTSSSAMGVRGKAGTTGYGVYGEGKVGVYGSTSNAATDAYGLYGINFGGGYAVYGAGKVYAGSLSIGDATAPVYPLDVFGTSDQMRLRYNAGGTIYARFQANASGNLVITTSGNTVDMSGDAVNVASLSSSGAVAGLSASFTNNASAGTFTEGGTALTSKYAPLSHTHTKSQITDFAHTHNASDIIQPAGSWVSVSYVNGWGTYSGGAPLRARTAPGSVLNITGALSPASASSEYVGSYSASLPTASYTYRFYLCPASNSLGDARASVYLVIAAGSRDMYLQLYNGDDTHIGFNAAYFADYIPVNVYLPID